MGSNPLSSAHSLSLTLPFIAGAFHIRMKPEGSGRQTLWEFLLMGLLFRNNSLCPGYGKERPWVMHLVSLRQVNQGREDSCSLSSLLEDSWTQRRLSL